MKSLWIGCTLLSLGLAAPAHAATRISIGFDINNAPPPPRMEFRHRPQFRYIPESQVYVIADDSYGADFFRYGSYYYVYNDGYWYRSSRYRGPFVVVRADYVPRPIFAVSANNYRWRQRPQWTPPGHRDRNWDRNHNRDNNRDWNDRNRHGG